MYLYRYTLESGLAGCSAMFDIFMTTGTFDCAERLLNGMKVPAQLFRSVEYVRQQLVQRFEDTMSKYDNMFSSQAIGNDFTTCHTDSNSTSNNNRGPSFQTGVPTGNTFVPVININANANANIIINNNPTTNNITTYINNAIVMIGEGGTNTFI